MTLVLTGVGYRYAGSRRPSLLDIDLELRDGTVVGLVGASESGKTTLCLVASGLAPRTVGGQVRGHITLDGEDVDAWPMHRLSERIGIGFANPATQLSQVAGTVFEEVAFGPMNLAVERDEVIERSWLALETLGIADLAERDPQRLSGGQQQLVAMAGLLAMRPEHLVLGDWWATPSSAWRPTARASWSPSRRPICCPRSPTRWWHSAMDASRCEVRRPTFSAMRR